MELTPSESSKLGIISQFSNVKRAKPELYQLLADMSPTAKILDYYC
jgi:hypothetical protein